MDTCRIVDYEDHYQPVFKELNIEWLDLYNLKEPRDVEMLDDPKKTILDGGGVIYLAQVNHQIVGSAALIYEGHYTYELAKMSVAKEFRQMGISKLLLEKCLERARTLHAKKIILFSNHQLKAALGLYEKYGFRHIPVEDSPFATADIKMEMELTEA